MDNMYKLKDIPFGSDQIEPIDLSEYISPIKIYICDQIMNAMIGEIARVGVSVDKEELIRALSYDREQYAEGYRAGAKAFATKWTSVANALPQIPGKYLVYSKVGTMYTSSFNPDIHKRWPHFGKVGVTHWMPMPEEPKKE
jgi:hypothetical protein